MVQGSAHHSAGSKGTSLADAHISLPALLEINPPHPPEVLQVLLKDGHKHDLHLRLVPAIFTTQLATTATKSPYPTDTATAKRCSARHT
jgi:hypothetical protein